MPGTLLTVALALLVGWGVWTFNRLVRSRNQARAGWSDVDVQLQRRHDLIPGLVESVKAYAVHERATLEAVTELRTLSQRATGPTRKARIEDQIQAATHRLVAIAEAYPELEADRHFLELQAELAKAEDHIQYARRFYNGAVRELNTRIERFPDLLVARAFAFEAFDFFTADDDAAGAIRVQLD